MPGSVLVWFSLASGRPGWLRGARQAGLADVDRYAAAQARGARWSALWEGLSRAVTLGAAGVPAAAAAAASRAVAAAEPMPLFRAMGLRLAAESALTD
jgi:hypothetical protein